MTAPTQYIITEEQIVRMCPKAEQYCDCPLCTVIREVRSHPYNPQAEQCVYWGKKDGKYCCAFLIPEPDLYVELTDKIRQDEREKVLDKLKKWRESEEYHLGMFHKLEEYETLWNKEWVFIKELRQEGKQEQP